MNTLALHRRLTTGLMATILLGASASFAATSSYTYDNLNRLTSAIIDGSRIEYVYDAAGNITLVLTPYLVATSRSGTGFGTVIDDLGKLDCGDDCSGVYQLGATVTLTAVPAPGSSFAGWSGACSGGGTCVVPVTGIHSVDAAFAMSSADLAVTKTDGLTVAIPGEIVDYTIVVSNAGPGAVSDASVSDVLPAGLTCTWTSVSVGGATGSAGSGAGDISETLVLPASSGVTYTASCAVDPGSTGSLSNTASVTTATPDPNPGDETATDVTDLMPAADHWLSLAVLPTQVGSGQAVAYTIQAGNQGPSQAGSVEVQHVLPASAGFVSFNAPDWACSESSGTVTCTRAMMDPLQSSTIEVTADMPSTSGVHSSTASVSSATPENVPGDEIDNADVEVFGPPTIVSVGSVAATESGSLSPDASTFSSITQILLDASHAMNDPGGDTDPNDVTNPECYRLFQAAPDGAFGSTTCSDPSNIPIGPILYGDAGEFEAALFTNGGVPLETRLYRLVACASGAAFLMDEFGSPLDGDGDGTGGDDFVLNFGVRVTNLFVNPNFDEDLNGWSITSQTAGDVIHDPAIDAGGTATSGSALLVNLTGAGSILEVSQCVAVSAEAAYVVTGKVSSASSGPVFPEVSAHVEMFDDAVCAGAFLSATDMGSIIGTSGGVWTPMWGSLVAAPTSAQSARVTFRVSGDEPSAQAWLDDLQLYFGGLYIFFDGFETGDTTHWD